MSRSERLLSLLQVLRRHRQPVSGQALARETGVSIRTLYRDIASLQSQGALIEGAPGLGYMMKPGFTLPPLMFGSEEIDAIVLGMRMVLAHGDSTLAQSASATLAKIAAVLPGELRRELEASALFIGACEKPVAPAIDANLLRVAIRAERKLRIRYLDQAGLPTERVVWPFALVYFDLTRMVMCWCELRDGFRNFRTDRIVELEMLDQRYPKNRQALMAEWRRTEYEPGRSILPETDSMAL